MQQREGEYLKRKWHRFEKVVEVAGAMYIADEQITASAISKKLGFEPSVVIYWASKSPLLYNAIAQWRKLQRETRSA